MLTGNINLDALNLIKNQMAVTSKSTGFDDLFNELLKLLFENKDISTASSANSNPFILPFVSFQNFLFQDITNFQELFQPSEFSSELKASLSLLQSGQIDIKELSSLLQNLNPQNTRNEIQSLIESLDAKILLNKETLQSNSSKLSEIVQNCSNKVNSEQFLFNSESFSSSHGKLSAGSPSTLLLNIVKTYSESSGNNSEFPNTELIKKTLNNEEVSSQLNIFHNIQGKTREDVQQKIELPFTRLSQVSDIIVKALSSSQKTIIVQLEPPELGKILIKLSMDNAGLRADMKVDYPHVKEALTGLIPEIKSNLQASGLKVSDFLLDLMKDNRGYSDSYNGQGQRKYRGNQKFFEYFV
ncbi:flagellar hook-length control protein FliK [Thermodesulfovibrio sp. Kuro-1]|uniref:flagellar hook-length control protein FliK n=1 Tax=Thermodesulfovibrio sp. Kuro-1 TaxID=2580394 RepID=UPI0015E84804|nr:flagellar hook-length control protein FliK [Thermodesulfovibrio sp. Kuro-1]